MGILSWFRGSGPPDKTTLWLRDRIRESAKHGDVAALLGACTALNGTGTMAFGMVVPVELAERAELFEEALAALRRMIPALPDVACDPVFAQIADARLPIDITERRTELVAKRRAAADRTAVWLREQIAKGDVIATAEACATLTGFGTMAFGMVLPAELERAPLVEAALTAIRERIPTLDADELRQLAPTARRARLDLALDDRIAELAADHAAERAALREAATASEPRNSALEAEVEANLDGGSDEPFMVLADWLQAQGHPRGELIALQLAGKPIDDHLSTHAGSLLGPLAPHRRVHDRSKAEALTWKRGFIHRARLSINEYPATTHDTITDILELLFAHPSARYLQELAVGMAGEGSDGLPNAAIAVIASEAPTSLRSLHLGDFVRREESEMSCYEIGNLASLWQRLRGLRTLIVQAGSFTLGAIDLPELRHAEFRTGGLSANSAKAIANATWPKLQQLDVWFGSPEWGCETTLDDVRAILAREDLKWLIHLGLENSAETDEICRLLVDAPIMAQLKKLDLSLGTMSDAGAHILAGAASKWPKLRLDVSRNWLSDDAVRSLRAAFELVEAGNQNEVGDDDDHRYPSVGE